MSMKARRLTLLLFLIITALQIKAQDENSSLPSTCTYEGHKLVLNGAGIREKYFIDLYRSGLYLKSRNTDAKTVVNADESMSIRIVVISDMVTSKRMEESIRESFKKATGGKIQNYETRINELIKAISENVSTGSIYDLLYLADKDMLKVLKDGKQKTEIKGIDFKKLVFSIWLGDVPVDEDLKKAMLGQ